MYRRKKFLLLAWFPDLKTVYHVAGDSEPYVYTLKIKKKHDYFERFNHISLRLVLQAGT